MGSPSEEFEARHQNGLARHGVPSSAGGRTYPRCSLRPASPSMLARVLLIGSVIAVLGLLFLIYLGESGTLVPSSPHWGFGVAVAAATMFGWVLVWVGLLVDRR
jgi:hypothetical protein